VLLCNWLCVFECNTLVILMEYFDVLPVALDDLVKARQLSLQLRYLDFILGSILGLLVVRFALPLADAEDR